LVVILFSTLLEPYIVDVHKLDTIILDTVNVLPIILEKVNVEPIIVLVVMVLPIMLEKKDEGANKVLAVRDKNESLTDKNVDAVMTFVISELPIIVDARILEAVKEDAYNVEPVIVE
jgi:hypothetical protein